MITCRLRKGNFGKCRSPNLATTPVLSPGIARAAVWVGLGAIARSRGIGWRLGLAAINGVYYNRRVFRDPSGHDYRGALYNKDIRKTPRVRWRISSTCIFASCVGYFDRLHYGFYVTSSRLLSIVLIEGNEISQMWNSVGVQMRSLWLCAYEVCIRPYLYWLDVIF